MSSAVCLRCCMCRLAARVASRKGEMKELLPLLWLAVGCLVFLPLFAGADRGRELRVLGVAAY